MQDAPHAESHLTQVRATCRGEGTGLPSPKPCYANRGGQAENWPSGGVLEGLPARQAGVLFAFGEVRSPVRVVTVNRAREPRRLWAPRSESRASSGTAVPGSARHGT